MFRHYDYNCSQTNCVLKTFSCLQPSSTSNLLITFWIDWYRIVRNWGATLTMMLSFNRYLSDASKNCSGSYHIILPCFCPKFLSHQGTILALWGLQRGRLRSSLYNLPASGCGRFLGAQLSRSSLPLERKTQI